MRVVPVGWTADHAFPGGDDILHVDVRREEARQAVGHDLGKLDQDVAKIANDCGVVAHLVPRRNRHLIRSARNDLFGRTNAQWRNTTLVRGLQKLS